MKFSEERIRHVSHLIVDAIYFNDIVDYDDEESVANEIKMAMTDYLENEDRIDGVVRKKIDSLSKVVPQGSREWDILYRKYFEEEMKKKNM